MPRRSVFPPVLVAALLILAGNAYLSFRAVRTISANNQLVTHTYDVQAAMDTMLTSLVDAESGQRAFLLTGQDALLERYAVGTGTARAQLKNLAALAADNPVQLERLGRLTERVERRITRLAERIEDRRRGAFDPSTLDEGRIEMEGVRALAGEFKQSEQALLTRRVEVSAASTTAATRTILTANAVAVFLLVVAFFVSRRELASRERAAADLREANAMLEQRVADRTHLLNAANTTLAAEVAERKAAQLQLDLANQELNRSNRELQDFAFVASHDLQEPLRKIQAFGDLIRSQFGESLEPAALDYLERMQNASRRMHRLINDLLTYSRVATRAQPFAALALGQTVEDALEDLETRIKDTGGTVDVGPLPFVEGDPTQMRQLFQNLIGNALKFHAPTTAPHVVVRGVVEPSSNGGPDWCRIDVADNGIGFEPKYLDRLFTPFQRLHGRDAYEGTGIGLAVCRRIVERHGGTITAVSAPNQGSTFTVRLPVQQREPTHVAES